MNRRTQMKIKGQMKGQQRQRKEPTLQKQLRLNFETGKRPAKNIQLRTCLVNTTMPSYIA